MRFTFFAVSAMLAAVASTVTLEAETQNLEEEYSREDLMEAAAELKQMLGVPGAGEQLDEQDETDEASIQKAAADEQKKLQASVANAKKVAAAAENKVKATAQPAGKPAKAPTAKPVKKGD